MRFKINKLFVAYLLVALVSAQFALAQHSTLHLDPNSHSTQQNSDDNEHDSDICQTCVGTKNLAQKYLPQSSYSFSLKKTDYQIASDCIFDNLEFLNKPFRSQAPPLLFS